MELARQLVLQQAWDSRGSRLCKFESLKRKGTDEGQGMVILQGSERYFENWRGEKELVYPEGTSKLKPFWRRNLEEDEDGHRAG